MVCDTKRFEILKLTVGMGDTQPGNDTWSIVGYKYSGVVTELRRFQSKVRSEFEKKEGLHNSVW